tara:strand:+ start:1312 stop:1605 length:294 start_codon:yes stop_codon:yes gene_type:complete
MVVKGGFMKKEDQICMSKDAFEKLIEDACCRAARKALHQIGLHDENATQDIKDLRDLLDSLRVAKSVAFKTLIRWITLGFIALLLAGVLSNINITGK